MATTVKFRPGTSSPSQVSSSIMTSFKPSVPLYQRLTTSTCLSSPIRSNVSLNSGRPMVRMLAQPGISSSLANSTPSPADSNLNFKGVAQFLGTALAGVAGAYVVHPLVLALVTEVWEFKQEGDDSFENSFFSLVGIIYGLMAGNTFLFLYERQVNIVQELYGEVFALELLLQQTFLSVEEEAPRSEMAAFIKRYIDEELYDPIEMTSPFDPDSSFSALIDVVVREKQSGCDVTGIVEAVQKLADAQSRRSAVAAQVLPGMHWVFLNSLVAIFVVCFLLFDATNDDASEVNLERRLAFSALVGVLVLTQQVLYDLKDPLKGLYTFRDCLEARLSYALKLLSQLETSKSGWVPPELAQLNILGLVGNITASGTAPSVVNPMRKGRKGRMDEQSYPGGPLHLMTHGNAAASSAPASDNANVTQLAQVTSHSVDDN